VVQTRINHVAMSMPEAVFDEAMRADVVRFYGEVFGWTRYVEDREPGNPLIMRMAEPTQFVYILSQKDGMVAPPMDHFGVEVAEESELDEALERAARFREKDGRVRIVEKKVTRYPVDLSLAPEMAGSTLDLVNCYIGYLLPLMVEIQHFRLAPVDG